MIDISKLRRSDKVVQVLTHDRMGTEFKILPAVKFVVHYPATPGAQMLPQEAACSLQEAEEIWSRVKRGRPDLKTLDIRISTVSGEFV